MLKAILFDLGNTLIEQKIDSSRRLDQMDLRLFPHVKETLEFLHKRYRIGMLTNTTQTNSKHVAKALSTLNIRDCFDCITTSVDERVSKPDPRIFRSALRQLSVEAKDCLMVGNSKDHDIEPAKHLGMKTAFFVSELDPTYIDAQFSSFADLPRLINDLERHSGSHISQIEAEANLGLKEHRWDEASANFLKIAHFYKDEGRFEDAANFFMQAAVAWERTEDWRGLGYLWVQCASALENRDLGPVTDLYDQVEASKHFFPTLDAYAWDRFSYHEKIGRAYRNAGYHLEKAGANQSAYIQYRKAGDAFSKCEQFDEASRSYFFCLSSFVDRHGESDPQLLRLLETTNEKLIEDDPAYLKRAQLYYRGLAGKLIAKGNFEQADEFFCKEHEISRKIAKRDRRYVKWFIYSAWNITAKYGTSFWRWTAWAIALFLVGFPMIFRFSRTLEWMEHGRFPRWLDYVFFSIMTVTTAGDSSFSPTYAAKWIILIESIVGFLMLGSLLTLFGKKALR